MINANGLRIGNLVTEQYQYFQQSEQERIITVESIIEKGINVDLHGESEYIGFDKLKPILLTEDWLARLRFVEEKRGCFTLGPISIVINEKTNSSWIYSQYTPTIPIQYVHQLQNLYFALTGKELKAPHH